MADENNDKPLVQQFSGISMKELIGAPLKAATDANAMISRSQVQFLLSSCFEKTCENGSSILKPIMVKFTLERQVLNHDGSMSDNTAKMQISVPLMSLIPINSLAIETLKISFGMEVQSSQEHSKDAQAKQENNKSQKRKASDSYNYDTELHGTLTKSSKSDAKSSGHAHYEITLTAGQLPLPVGVTAILDMFTKNLAPIPAKSNTETK